FGRADANVLRDAASNPVRHGRQVLKERGDECEQFLSLRGQRERAALKERHAEGFLQLDDLAAHGRLLDAIGHVANGLADAAVPGNIIKQFEVVNIHASVISMRPLLFINYSISGKGDTVRSVNETWTQTAQLNLCIAWIWMVMGFGSGFVLGLNFH